MAMSCGFAVLPAIAAAQAEDWTPLDRAPAEIERLLLGLPTAGTGLPLAARQGMLRRAEALEIPRVDGPADRYFRLRHEAEGAYFTATIRSLAGAKPGDTVYLLQADQQVDRCAALQPLLARADRVPRNFCRDDADMGVAVLRTDRQRFGYTAWRVAGGGKPRDVTGSVLPADPVARLPVAEREGTSSLDGVATEARVDRSRLAEVPVLRLYLEYGDGHGLPRNHPRAFPGGYPGEKVHTAHLGFLVWDGHRFDLRPTVPRRLWPCTHDAAFSPSGQSCHPDSPDPFIESP
ncbi:MAG: hypothetical protein JNM58_12130 [Xanthomonadaceae bacterium]|nr:hypothetical protein [Xanthomonadaceae bacterium]